MNAHSQNHISFMMFLNFLLSKAIVPTGLKGAIPIPQFAQIPALAIVSSTNTVLNVGFATPII